jgi:hypothetical protein
MHRVPSVDLILFWGLVGTIGVAHSLLLTSGTPWETTTWFYILMWATSMIILLFCWVRYKEKAQWDYDESLTQNKLLYVLGGLVATIFLSSVLVQAYTRSSIWVPQPHQTLDMGGLSLSEVINDLFYQLALVSNSEETMVLSMSQVIRRKLAESFSIKHAPYAAGLSIAIPRAGWAVLHAYVSYVGPLMPILVISAFISGLIISYCAYNRQVKSFLAATLIHFGFNASVVVANALGLM